ncbi:hypothetical protein SAMN05920897_11185 [Alkalispirochaeta americana]|uniref:Uncharacterized protein n=1 Tax=Alkalispirochaeta americana TaxID=159291 RepID=A0A1N6U2N4_9SPIO|nr:hypothetical protein [Alkalispirochaeta americana]SIQ59918.1 hypothetical protein SAMN05920897_11185 [Alkalispirochaeta americana]
MRWNPDDREALVLPRKEGCRACGGSRCSARHRLLRVAVPEDMPDPRPGEMVWFLAPRSAFVRGLLRFPGAPLAAGILWGRFLPGGPWCAFLAGLAVLGLAVARGSRREDLPVLTGGGGLSLQEDSFKPEEFRQDS